MANSVSIHVKKYDFLIQIKLPGKPWTQVKVFAELHDAVMHMQTAYNLGTKGSWYDPFLHCQVKIRIQRKLRDD